jgi:hypothetical protein
MKDKEFLQWLSQRLIHVYGESEDVDFVTKLQAIAHSLHHDRCTPNVIPVITDNEGKSGRSGRLITNMDP